MWQTLNAINRKTLPLASIRVKGHMLEMLGGKKRWKGLQARQKKELKAILEERFNCVMQVYPRQELTFDETGLQV